MLPLGQVKIFDSLQGPCSPLEGESKSLILERGNVKKQVKLSLLT
jgi:hypothetical protein